ncbi:GNAT family N-acetyltransferase [Eubacterium sp. 1001713B170207_170306_E7]|uniref:GNAT family N-acetyltransferase n=1 Tax=Eubacterium sp. 1001713B170207_170306_E7 TaxID=2787097 RepID=UPI001897600C|nr:GNAT family N-acetyltransferase [Eubacterium sp. 1001713B170207_170306_E7]
MNIIIREIREAEIPRLKDFLYEAVFIPPGAGAPPRAVVDTPELQVYVRDFGRQAADLGLVAEVDGRIAGAVWARIMEDYGHIDDDTPSLAIALFKAYRGLGIGTGLMRAMLSALEERGFAQVSLSVQKANRALKLYERLGFRAVAENGDEYKMVKTLGGQRHE